MIRMEIDCITIINRDTEKSLLGNYYNNLTNKFHDRVKEKFKLLSPTILQLEIKKC